MYITLPYLHSFFNFMSRYFSWLIIHIGQVIDAQLLKFMFHYFFSILFIAIYGADSESTCSYTRWFRTVCLGLEYVRKGCAISFRALCLSSTQCIAWNLILYIISLQSYFYYGYSITHSLFHSRLKSFLFCESSLPQPFLCLLQDSLYGFPRLFTATSEQSVFLLFSVFSVFTLF